jgi:uncharacterized glyoxalase superfamily protein PhnB
MKNNRSMPNSSVIPVLGYPDINEAIDWLCNTFGFSIRWSLTPHRAQLNVEADCVVITETNLKSDQLSRGYSIMIRVKDIENHYNLVKKSGAKILSEPVEYPYGEKQYSVEDLVGRIWTFSETIADVSPEEFGARIHNL